MVHRVVYTQVNAYQAMQLQSWKRSARSRPRTLQCALGRYQGTGGYHDLPLDPVVVEVRAPPRIPRGEPVGTNLHRKKVTSLPFGCIARIVGKKEMLSTPKAAEAVKVEYDKLIDQGAWNLEEVEDWHDVRNRARETGQTIHIGRIFAICVE